MNENKVVLRVFTRTSRYNTYSENISFNTSLIFTKDRLDIRYLGMFKMSFLKEDIISIEPYGTSSLISFADWFIINHKVDNYSNFLVFKAPFKNYGEVIKKIEPTGFLDKKLTTTDQSIVDDVRKTQERKIFPNYLVILIIACLLILFTYVIIR